MRRYILTGTPGSGKTSILRILGADGYAIVDEAATDVIAAEQAGGVAEPWLDPRFIDKIIDLQCARQQNHDPDDPRIQVYDRSPVCTLALARYLGYPISVALAGELNRITDQGIYDRRVFFVRPLGFVEPTSARRISYQESLEFERLHEAEYTRIGFRLIDIPAASPQARAALIDAHLRG